MHAWFSSLHLDKQYVLCLDNIYLNFQTCFLYEQSMPHKFSVNISSNEFSIIQVFCEVSLILLISNKYLSRCRAVHHKFQRSRWANRSLIDSRFSPTGAHSRPLRVSVAAQESLGMGAESGHPGPAIARLVPRGHPAFQSRGDHRERRRFSDTGLRESTGELCPQLYEQDPVSPLCY